MRIVLILIIFLTTLSLIADTKKTADSYFEQMQMGNYAKCIEMSDQNMQKNLPVDKLKEVWESLPNQLGKLIGVLDYSMVTQGEYEIHIYVLNFDKMVMDMKITVDKENKISGLFYTMSKTPKPGTALKLPDYLDKEKAVEKDVSFDCEKMMINGKLTTPIGYENYPLVLMLTGSGPNDMDETIAQRKPFRDLAIGLANKGIATLRWNKRTLDYPQIGNRIDFSPRDEYIIELNAALRWMKDNNMNNSNFVLGHSMGAFMLPQIAQENDKIKGFIMLAGNARPLEDLVAAQYEYIFGLHPMTSQIEAELAKIKKQSAEIKELTAETEVTEPLLLGIPKAYWLWMNYYKQTEVLGKTDSPFMILQGEKDYQVTMEDFSIWESVAEGRPNIVTKSYPILDHLFMPCSGDSTPDSYLNPSFVSKKVIEDIAEWITSTDK
ncbi:MAG: DUF3887 domain-containing protein [Candidatus Zophobacter franzmannii]|nr:DUF3887 domain-containing protein [Candidatus Zophobacter franzmannii]